jgi:hypothetical protein
MIARHGCTTYYSIDDVTVAAEKRKFPDVHSY